MLDPERCWQALCERDANYDGRFVFAVRTTGIFCYGAALRIHYRVLSALFGRLLCQEHFG